MIGKPKPVVLRIQILAINCHAQTRKMVCTLTHQATVKDILNASLKILQNSFARMEQFTTQDIIDVREVLQQGVPGQIQHNVPAFQMDTILIMLLVAKFLDCV